MDWFKDNLESVISSLGLVGVGVYGFLRRVNKIQSDTESLRHEFDQHLQETAPLVASFIEVRSKVESLDERMENQFHAVLQQIKEGRDDVRALNATLISLMRRGFGNIRATDDGKD